MANFAKAQLLKYGWTEGKGLGKNENGITEALKPKLKFNTEGLGHKLEEVQWWESAFNNAIKNVSVSSENDEVSISVTNTNNISSSIKTEENIKENQLVQQQYNNFRKTSMLQDEKLIMLKNTDVKEEEEKPVNKIPLLTDDELFKACGGRTGHKGARHGLGLNGKLERIARQEQKLLGFMPNLSSKEIGNNSTTKSEDTIDEVDDNANALLTVTDTSCSEENGFLKTKSALKKERRKIRNLSHLLSVSCNIDENSSSSTVDLHGKKSSLKRKRSKDRKTNVNNDIIDGNILSTVTLEDHDMSSPTNAVFEKKTKKHKRHNKHNTAKEDCNTSSSIHDCKTLSHDSIGNTSSKLKKKSKSQENGETSTEATHNTKKLRHQKKRIIKLMEKMNFGSNSEDERVKNEEKDSAVDVIKSENTFSPDEALRLNRRISKKKKNRLNKKNKKKAYLERSISTIFSERKSSNAMESLMSVDITDDVTAKLKASKNMRNKKQIKEKKKNDTDCNTDI